MILLPARIPGRKQNYAVSLDNLDRKPFFANGSPGRKKSKNLGLSYKRDLDFCFVREDPILQLNYTQLIFGVLKERGNLVL